MNELCEQGRTILYCLVVSFPASSLRAPEVVLHDLKNETSFKCLEWHQGNRGGDVTTVHTDHVGVLVVSEVVHLLGFLVPGVPDDGVGKVVFLDPHLPARHHVGNDVLMRSVDVNPGKVKLELRRENISHLSVHSLRVTTSRHSWYAGGWGGAVPGGPSGPCLVLSRKVTPLSPVTWHRLTSGHLK